MHRSRVLAKWLSHIITQAEDVYITQAKEARFKRKHSDKEKYNSEKYRKNQELISATRRRPSLSPPPPRQPDAHICTINSQNAHLSGPTRKLLFALSTERATIV